MTDTPVEQSAVLAVRLLEAILSIRLSKTKEEMEAYAASGELLDSEELDAVMDALFESDYLPQAVMHLASIFGSAILTIGSVLAKNVPPGMDKSGDIENMLAGAFKDKVFFHYLSAIQEMAEENPNIPGVTVESESSDMATWIADVAANVDEVLNERSS